MRRRFFVEQFSGGAATLVGPAAHHLARVLRADPGQLYELSDGRSIFLARVERVSHDRVDFAVVEPVAARVSLVDATLYIAVVKFDRFEWALEKATELGVRAIVPVAAARSERTLVAAAPKRATRWRKIVMESAQQARCLRPPELRPTNQLRGALLADRSAIRILLSERTGANPLKTILDEKALQRLAAPVTISLAIGPEGGWTDDEFAAAETAQFAPASLGDNILRTETAVVASLAAAHLYLD